MSYFRDEEKLRANSSWPEAIQPQNEGSDRMPGLLVPCTLPLPCQQVSLTRLARTCNDSVSLIITIIIIVTESHLCAKWDTGHFCFALSSFVTRLASLGR